MSLEIKWLILKRAEVTFWEENCAVCWLNPQGFLFTERHVGFTHEEHAQSARDDCTDENLCFSFLSSPLSCQEQH